MKPSPSGLRWHLHDLVGSRLRFAILLLVHILGFTLTIVHLDLSARQVMDLSLWGLAAPVFYLVLLRRVFVSTNPRDERERGA